jgi:hypothetical protein
VKLVESGAEIAQIIRDTKTIAVLGIKPESHAGAAAFYVPEYLHQRGLRIIPVPVYYPDVTEILGQPVFRSLQAIGEPIDMVDVFRRPQDIPPHLPDLLAARPKVVWFQLGIRHDEVAAKLVEAGISVVQDRCLMVDHQRYAR